MNQHQLAEMFKLVEKAKTMERVGNENKALEIYLDLLENYTPNTSDAYERPAIILERRKRYDEALKICETAIELINDNKLGGTVAKFEKRIEKIQSKMDSSTTETRSSEASSPTSKINFKNIAIVVSFLAVLALVIFLVSPKESPYEDLYIDMSDFDRVSQLEGSMFIDEEGNKLPEITISMIDYARNVCNINSEVENSLVIIQNGTIGFGILVKDDISKDKAESIANEFIKALAKAASNEHKELSSPTLGTYGGLYEHYDIIISIGKSTDDIDYRASMNKKTDTLVWRNK